MTADHLSYGRATSVALIGLAIQVLLGTVMLIYGILGADAGALTGGLAMLLGIIIWLALALVFHQHKLERLEALENEAYLASAAAQASVFGEGGANELQQGQRLAWMHRWFLPSISVLVALAFIGLGGFRFLWMRDQLDDDTVFAAPQAAGWAISIGVGTAVIGFIFARFVAGMAKQKVWILLHAGSATAVGAAIIGAAVALAHFIVVAAKSEVILRYMGPALSIFMVALGAEMLMNFVLNLYRPRKAGEYQRPAFDSRVLSFVAAPDKLAESISEAINYQFGFNVSSTWFYQLLARSVLSLVVLGGVVLWAMSIFTVVRPHERGLLLRNGQLIREVGPGLVVDLPWPFTRVEKFSAEALNEIHVGTPAPDKEGPILWTNEHTVNEKFLLVQPSGGPAGGQSGSGDLNLLAIEVPIHYIVTDLTKYKLLATDGPKGRIDQVRRDLLTSIASSAVIEYVATLNVDEVLGAKRRTMSEDVRRIVQGEFDRLDAGVRVIFAGIAGAHPEKEAAPAFEGVVQADLRRLTAVERAQADSIRTLATVVGEVDRARSIITELDALEAMKDRKAPADEITKQEQKVNELIASAGGEASVLISEARADRWKKHMDARSRAATSAGMIASYRAAPTPFRMARYVDALRSAARDARVWITPPDHIRITLDQSEAAPSVQLFGTDPQAK